MGVVLHWFLPTSGDSRTDLSLGNVVGVAGSRVAYHVGNYLPNQVLPPNHGQI